MEAIILLGPPGSGKGTVAEDLKDALHFEHISTGDMLRNAIRLEKPVGLEAKSYMEKGELVPDEVIVKLVEDLLQSGDPSTRYMFDGFPRTVRQAEMLDQALLPFGSNVRYAFLLEVDRAILVRRICGRRVCRNCGAVYNVHNRMPKVEGVCDQCGEKAIYQRPDDSEETLNNRLEVYNAQTASLIDYYQEKGTLVRIDAEDREATEQTILDHLSPA